MQRILMDKLIQWKDEPDRKPVLLQGVRHSGKTYLLKEFGKNNYDNVIYIDFDKDKSAAYLFSQNPEPLTVIKNLSIYYEKDITAHNTLIILDEIHLCPDAIEMIRLLYDTAPDYHIAAASSYINVAMPHGTSVPFGKVESMTLYPMNFYEFLLAQSPMLAHHLKESGFKAHPYKTFQKQLEDKFSDYQITGGMPQVVKSWIDNKSIEAIDNILEDILRCIESDISTLCTGTFLPKVIAVFNAIAAQLIKGNRKFMFSKVNKNWRGKNLDDAVYWLLRTGLIYKVEHINNPGMPVSVYVNPAHFKLYMCDTGLLRRSGTIPAKSLMNCDNSFPDVKSAVIENIVCGELIRHYKNGLYYWSAENPGRAEVEFIVQAAGELIPIEVKHGSANKARSLQQYKLRFNPKKSVLTGTDTDKDDILPIYGFWNIEEWLKRVGNEE